MKVWPFSVGTLVLSVAGMVFLALRDPRPGSGPRAARELLRVQAERVTAPMPKRFSGPVPSRTENFQQEQEQSPPPSHVRFRLLERDPAMSERYLAALRREAASVSTVLELERLQGGPLGIGVNERWEWGDLVLERHQGVPCEWLQEQLRAEDPEPPLVRELFWRGLSFCQGPEVDAIFAREDAPGFPVLAQHGRFARSELTPALEKTVRRILERNQQELFVMAALELTRCEEPVARALLGEIHQRAEAATVAAMEEVAPILEYSPRKVDEGWRPRCAFIPTRPDGIDYPLLRECLDAWAFQNWAATARLADVLLGSYPDNRWIEDRLNTLTRFSSVTAQDAWARERGLLPGSWPQQGQAPSGISLIERMREAGRMLWVDTQVRDFPYRHDELLVTLAWQVHPELAGVSFEEIPPERQRGLREPEGTGGSYVLRAYADGQRFSVTAQNMRWSQDIDAVVGLLNQLLEMRGSRHRFALLFGDSFTAAVPFGPEAALREADALGLWRLAAKGEALAQAEAGRDQFFREIFGL